MSFLNWMLLGGSAAFAAPLLIHLLNRSRFQIVDWGAMHLLESALQSNSRRLRWEAILLLFIRCLIPIILACCLARPVITYMQIPGLQGRKSLVFLIDDSLSMSERNADGKSAFDRAKVACAAIARQFNNAQTGIWTLGQPPVDVLQGSTFVTAAIEDALSQLECSDGRTDGLTGLDEGIRQLTAMTNPSKHLVLVSDFRNSDWNPVPSTDLARLRDRLDSTDVPIQLTLLDTQTRPAKGMVQPDNLAIRFDPETETDVLVGETKEFVLRIHNFGLSSQEHVEVLFEVNQQIVSRRDINVAPDSVEQAVFACEFPQAGWHSVAARIQDSPGLQRDNQCYHVVRVAPPISVVLIAARSTKQFNSESDFLRLALSPFAEASTGQNRFQIRQFEPDELSVAQLNSNQQVAILIGVPKLKRSVAQALHDFVKSGGGLIVFPTNDTNQEPTTNGINTMFPMRYGDRSRAAPPIKLWPAPLSLPELQIFNRDNSGNVSNWDFDMWQEIIEPKDDDRRLSERTDNSISGSNQPQVVMRLSNQSPFLVAGKFGLGTVLQCAVSCGDGWSNLPTKPVYVPFMQQLVLAAYANSVKPNVSVGETVTLRSNDASNFAFGTPVVRNVPSTGEPSSMETNPVVSTEIGSSWVTSLDSTGLFTVGDGRDKDLASDFSPQLIAVRSSRRESDLRLLPGTQVEDLARQLGASVVHSAGEFSEDLHRHTHGKEIWRWFWLGLLGLLFTESCLCRHLARDQNSLRPLSSSPSTSGHVKRGHAP